VLPRGGRSTGRVAAEAAFRSAANGTGVRDGKNEDLVGSRRDARGSARNSYARGDLHAARIDPQNLVRATVHNLKRTRPVGNLNEIGARHAPHISR